MVKELLFAMSMFACAPLALAQRAAGARPVGSINVKTQGRDTLLLPSDLAKLPRHDLRVLAEGSGDSATVSGIYLWDILQAVGVPSPEASGRQRVVMYVRLAGADGQNAVISLVEIDPGFSSRTAIVTDRRNGKALDAAEGPWRVLVPDDMRHARWIRGLLTIEVASVKR